MQCQFEWSGYPHEGCAEFGPPDEFTCLEPAVWKFDYENPVPFPGESDIETVHFCTFHGNTALVLSDDIVDIEKLKGGENMKTQRVTLDIEWDDSDPEAVEPVEWDFAELFDLPDREHVKVVRATQANDESPATSGSINDPLLASWSELDNDHDSIYVKHLSGRNMLSAMVPTGTGKAIARIINEADARELATIAGYLTSVALAMRVQEVLVDPQEWL